MKPKRTIEILSAGCPACEETIQLVNENACPSCEIQVVDVTKDSGRERVKQLGIKTIPAVVIDGKISKCCNSSGPDLKKLKEEGLGRQ